MLFCYIFYPKHSWCELTQSFYSVNLILAKFSSFLFLGFHFSRPQNHLQIPPVFLAALTTVTHPLSYFPTCQRITTAPLLQTLETMTAPQKITHVPPCPHMPRMTTSSPAPPPAVTVHPVRLIAWTPFKLLNISPTPAQTMWGSPPQRPPPVISTRQTQTVTCATVNRNNIHLEYGKSSPMFLPNDNLESANIAKCHKGNHLSPFSMF